GETHIFVGQGYIVTVRHGASLTYQGVRKRCESTPKLLEHGESFVLYALLDFVVDNYFPILDEIETEIERIEDAVFQDSNDGIDVARVYELRRDLLTMR